MFSVLNYPVEQPYRIRWITEIFYAGSAVSIVLLVIFNLVVSGYDTVTVVMQNPNITDPNQWWAPSWVPKALRIIRTAPGECEPAVLPLNTPLTTNSSLPLFSYTLSNTLSEEDVRDPYKANPLDKCRMQSMSMLMEAKAVYFAITATLSCNMAPNTTRPRQFSVHFKSAYDTRFQPDTIVDYMASKLSRGGGPSQGLDKLSRRGPPKDSFLNVLGVVDGLCSDLTQLMWMQRVVQFSNSTLQGAIPELGYVSLESPPDALGPVRLDFGTYDETPGYYYYEEDNSYFSSMNTTIANIFVAIRDAIYLDVGYVTPANMYINRTMFNNLITPDSHFTEVVLRMPHNYPYDDFSTPSWGWGYAPGHNTSWAQALTSTDQPVNNITLPITLTAPLPPSVIDIMYLCPQYQLKSWGSLLMVVFTGTFTTYASLYGLFAWLVPILDQKRHGPQPLELLVDRHTREMQLAGSGPLVSDLKSSKSSLDLESSIKERLLSDGFERHA